MKKTLISTLLLALSSNSFARSSSKDRAIQFSIGGCGVGLATGLYMDSQDNASDKDTVGTLGINTAIGCGLGMAWSYFFVDDDQEQLVRQNDAQRKKIEDLERVIRTSSGRGSDKAKFLDSMQLQENFQGKEALTRLVDPNCLTHRFYLGFDGRAMSNLYIPVDEGIVITSLEYFVARPKNSNDRSTVCVKDLKPFGYLNLELPGLGDLLFSHAKTTLRKQKEYSK